MLTMYNKKKEKKFGSSSPFGIFVDQAGYLPEGSKLAVIPFFAETFAIVDENGDKLFEGATKHFGVDECSEDDIYIADFTAFKRHGSYRVTAGDKKSALFRIGTEVYSRLLQSVTKAYYYLRCGSGLDPRFAGVFAHPRCHCTEAEVLAEGSIAKIIGGWHDAGDYGRYVTAGACACAQLLYSYKLFPKVFVRQSLDIPETGSGIPDILSECRYELDWLLKMQRDDGAVHHKETTMRHASFLMPDKDISTMYIFTVSSSATADFCAVCALASGIFAPYDEQYSKRLKRASERAYAWLEDHPEFVGFTNPAGCDTGLYAEDSDIDNRYWAAAELFNLTGEQKYHDQFLRLYNSPYFESREYAKTSLGYGMIGGLGTFAYMLSQRPGRDEAAVARLKDLFLGEAYWLRDKARQSGYCASMDVHDYYWGSNMVLMHHAVKFIMAYMLTGAEEFYLFALEQLHVLLGRNAMGISYVTGFGEFSVIRPHYRPTIADGIEECIPGFVIGGPNKDLTDQFAKELIPINTPATKCYYDDERCYSLNEIAIYWNSPTVFLLAAIESRENGDMPFYKI